MLLTRINFPRKIEALDFKITNEQRIRKNLLIPVTSTL